MSPEAAPVSATPAPSTPAAPASTPAQDAGASPGAAGAKPSTAGATKPEAPKLKEYKIDGKIVKLTEEEIDQYVSLGFASDGRFKSASKLMKQAEGVIGRLRDPNSVMEALLDPSLGLSKDQIRQTFEEWYAREFIEPERLSPEQKKLRDAEAKLKKYEETEKQREEKRLADERDAMTTQQREHLQKQLIEVLETNQLPRTNFTIRRLAYWMQRNNENGFEATPQQLVNQVRSEYNANLRDSVEASDGEVLIQLLGDSIVQKIRKYDLEQLRKLRNPGSPAAHAREATPSAPAGERPPTSSEVTQRIRQMQRTGRY